MAIVGEAQFHYGELHCTAVVAKMGESLNLTITLTQSDSALDRPLDNSDKMQEVLPRIEAAARIALDLDASIARHLRHGAEVNLQIERPRRMPTRRVVDMEDAARRRPKIEELVSPILFGALPHPAIRSFQTEGVEWLIRTPRAILADDMGLGKTAQTLLAAQRLILKGAVRSAVVVCPKSLVLNWENECSKWIPALTVMRPMPTTNDATRLWHSILGRAHIIVCNYEQLRPLPASFIQASQELIITDEAHRLRRSQAQLVRVFRQIRSERLWALTGTPIERHPSDFATLLSLLEPRKFSSRSGQSESDLRRRAKPYVLRRRKEEVLEELPDVIDVKESLELTPMQRDAYESTWSQPVSRSPEGILKRLQLLRTICDVDPSSESSSKLDRIVEILASVKDAEEKAIVFSYRLRPLHLLDKRLSRTEPRIGKRLLVGELSIAERADVVHEFKRHDGVTALLCSSRVAGEGLTLTEANHVIFLNEWWNPSANNQARDRVVRLGQERVVQVHRFRCVDTVEEALDDILDEKDEAFTRIIDALAAEVGSGYGDVREALTETLAHIDHEGTETEV